MKASEQDLSDAIEQLTQHIQVLYETIEDLRTEVQWANNHRFAPMPDSRNSMEQPNESEPAEPGLKKTQGGLF